MPGLGHNARMQAHSRCSLHPWRPWRACAAAVLGALALAVFLPAAAAPAPWYWWVSKLDGQRVCAQTTPGQGWERGDGPFTQAGCQRVRRSPGQRR